MKYVIRMGGEAEEGMERPREEIKGERSSKRRKGKGREKQKKK